MFPKLCLAVLVYLLVSANGFAQSPVMFPASPQANGRAGIYTSSENADPLAPLSNPGLLGLMAAHNRVALAFYPQRTRGVQYWFWEELVLSSRALFVGLDRQYFHWKLPLSVGVGYHETNLAYSQSSRPSGIPYPRLNSKGFSIGLGLEYPHLKAGIGYNQKFARVGWDGRTPSSTADFGLFLEAPSNFSLTRARVFITPSFGYSLLNVGARYGNYDELPERTAKVSFAVSTGITAHHPAGTDWRLLTIEGGVEGEDLLVEHHGNDVYYQGAFGDIEPIHDLLLGESNPGITKRAGLELGLGEVGYLRWGNYVLSHTRLADYIPYRYKTDGFGLRLAGMMKVATLLPALRANHVLAFIVRRVDVQYDVCTISKRMNPFYAGWVGPDDPHDQHVYHELSVLFRY